MSQEQEARIIELESEVKKKDLAIRSEMRLGGIETEALKVRIAELESFQASQRDRISRMQEELDLADAEIATNRQRSAELDVALNCCLVTLDKLAKLGNGDQYGNSVGNVMALETLRLILGNGYH